jgi:hypothetical protein
MNLLVLYLAYEDARSKLQKLQNYPSILAMQNILSLRLRHHFVH